MPSAVSRAGLQPRRTTIRCLTPDEFLTREAFDRLSHDEQQAYVGQFVDALGAALEGSVDIRMKLKYTGHALDLADYLLPAAEADRLRRQWWEAIWARIADVVTTLEWAVESPDLDEDERRNVRRVLEETRTMAAQRPSLQ